MKRKWFVAIFVLLALSGAIYLYTRQDPSEPLYKGVRISRWIAVTTHPAHLDKGLAEIGPESIPHLRRALHISDNPLRRVSVWDGENFLLHFGSNTCPTCQLTPAAFVSTRCGD